IEALQCSRGQAVRAPGLEGLADSFNVSVNLSRPSGTCAHRPSSPNVETLGYYRKSLRDKDLPAFCECQWIKSLWHWVWKRAHFFKSPASSAARKERCRSAPG